VTQEIERCLNDYKVIDRTSPRDIILRRYHHRRPLVPSSNSLTMSITEYLWSLLRKTLPDGGVAFGDENQDLSTSAAIVTQCEAFMRKNLLTGEAHGHEYSFNQPSSFKYSPSQWLWGRHSS